MAWRSVLTITAILHTTISPLYGIPHFNPLLSTNDNYLEEPNTELTDNTDLQLESDAFSLLNDDEKFQRIWNYLAELLLRPTNDKGLPLVYVEQDENNLQDIVPEFENTELTPNQNKRSRYYRKYPWKRQNLRDSNYHCVCKYNTTNFNVRSSHPPMKIQENKIYDAENRFLCQPSKDDVYRLLVALHESRQEGTRGKHINFCNRKRPATLIFTDLRFLG